MITFSFIIERYLHRFAYLCYENELVYLIFIIMKIIQWPQHTSTEKQAQEHVYNEFNFIPSRKENKENIGYSEVRF